MLVFYLVKLGKRRGRMMNRGNIIVIMVLIALLPTVTPLAAQPFTLPPLPPLVSISDKENPPLPPWADINTVWIGLGEKRLVITASLFQKRPDKVNATLVIYVDKDANTNTGCNKEVVRGADFRIIAVNTTTSSRLEIDEWNPSSGWVPTNCSGVLEWKGNVVKVDAELPSLSDIVRIKIRYDTQCDSGIWVNVPYLWSLYNQLRLIDVDAADSKGWADIKYFTISSDNKEARFGIELAQAPSSRSKGTEMYVISDALINKDRSVATGRPVDGADVWIRLYYICNDSGAFGIVRVRQWSIENWGPISYESVLTGLNCTTKLISWDVPLANITVSLYTISEMTASTSLWVTDLVPDNFVSPDGWITVVRALLHFTLKFVKGWNLFSIPIMLSNSTIEAIFPWPPGESPVGAIYYWNCTSGTWMSWIPGISSNTLKRLEVGKGYWLYANKDFNIELVGYYPRDVDIGVGIKCSGAWNQIGVVGLSPINAEEFLKRYGGTYIYAWNNSTQSWQVYAKGRGGDFTSLEPGKGYFLYIPP